MENTVVYDPPRIAERYGLAPAQMIDYKALKGDTTDNIPGVPGVGEKTAAKLVAEFGDLDALYARLDEVSPEKLRDKLREFREQVLAQPRARDDPSATCPLGWTWRRPASATTTATRSSGSSASTSSGRSSTGCRRSSGETRDEASAAIREETAEAPIPAARVEGRPDGLGPRRGGRPRGRPRPAGLPRARPRASLQLSLDFGAVPGPANEPAPAAPPRPAEPLPSGDLRPPWPRSSPTRAAWSGSTRPTIAGLGPWLAARSARGRRASSSTIPGRGSGAPLALALAGEDGRVVAAAGPRTPTAAPARPGGGRHAARRPRGEAAPRRPLRRRPGRRPAADRLRHADRGLPPQRRRCAARRSPTSSPSGSDLVLPPAAAGLAPERAGRRWRRSARWPSAGRSPTPSSAAGLDRLFAELELPLVPVLARMEATGVAIDLEALGRARRGVRGASSTAWSARSTPPSATSSTWAARSSSSRSSSTS